MQAAEMKELAEALLSVTLAAARVQMAHFAAGVTVETKADHSPVTVADRESEDIILAGLARAAPGVPVVSEEAASVGRIPSTGDSFFLVDPLDGTKPFIRGSPQFTINIALIAMRQTHIRPGLCARNPRLLCHDRPQRGRGRAPAAVDDSEGPGGLRPGTHPHPGA